MRVLKYPSLSVGVVGAWCPSVDNSRSTRLTDFSGYGSHGTLTNMDPGTDWVASGGKIALDFDGTNDYVAIPFSFVSTEITMSCWIKTTSSTTALTAMSCNNAASDGTLFKMGSGLTTGDKAGFQIRSDTFGSGSFGDSTTTINTGLWFHLAMILRISGSWDGYVNGVREAGVSGLGADVWTFTKSAIGCLDRSSTAQFWLGAVDDARVYNRALTPPEFTTLALRRGIAYETRRSRIGKATATTRNRNNMLIGCGF